MLNADIVRTSLVSRFDTIVFNPEEKMLEVWRYGSGCYIGEHKVVFSITVSWIDSDAVLIESILLIGKVAQLLAISEQLDLPKPWKGFRFI